MSDRTLLYVVFRFRLDANLLEFCQNSSKLASNVNRLNTDYRLILRRLEILNMPITRSPKLAEVSIFVTAKKKLTLVSSVVSNDRPAKIVYFAGLFEWGFPCVTSRSSVEVFKTN